MKKVFSVLLALLVTVPVMAQSWGPLTLPQPTAADDLKYVQWNATTRRYQLSTVSVAMVANGTEGQVLRSGASTPAWASSVAVGINHVTKTATGDLSAAEVNGTIISNYGQGAASTLTLPAAAAGYNFIAVVGTAGAGALHIKAGASDKLYLDGVALDDGDKASLATPALGNTLTCFTFQTGASAYDWICTGGGGAAWTGGA